MAACASIALWSCFQSTGYKFHHHIPSPVEITKCASEHFAIYPKRFPNQGLTFEQVALSFRNYNLEPYLVNIENEFVFKLAVYSYVKAQLPIVMGFEILDSDGNSIGFHAVTILGINVEKPEKSWSIAASGINKIYVHDDQVGPYARMKFMGNGNLSTSWGDKCIAKPRHLAIPLTSKIRIDYIQANSICVDFAFLFETTSNYPGISPVFDGSTTFDCYLSSMNDIKQFMLNESGIDYVEKSKFLQQNQPKHIWRIVIAFKDNWFEIGLDATDIEQGDFFSYSITNSGLFKDFFKMCLEFALVNAKILKSDHTIEILRHIV